MPATKATYMGLGAADPSKSRRAPLLEYLPACDVGGKRDSKGNTSYWVGDKVSREWGVPLAAVTTAPRCMIASGCHYALHARESARDGACTIYWIKAYDAAPFHAMPMALGRRPIIDLIERYGQEVPPPIEPDQAKLFSRGAWWHNGSTRA